MLGTLVLGLCSDFFPMRSPLFIGSILVAGAFSFVFTYTPDHSFGWIAFLIFMVGFFMTGAQGIIAAIECDIGRKESQKNGHKALATISGIIDGIASFGSAVGMLIIGEVIKSGGWQATMLMLSLCIILGALPGVYFLYLDIKERRKS